jgi:NitT/TauT family transport system substrate-binding protein
VSPTADLASASPNDPAGAGGRRIGRKSSVLLAVIALASVMLLTGCGIFGEPTTTINVGYQSKTINTVNAGTLMRDRRAFEDALEELGKVTGKKYRVVWQDFASGAPLTAAMMASHVDIGSMGDYPLLTNGSKTKKYSDAETEWIATTGYNLRGSLNQVVVPTGSDARTLSDLVGKKVSTSLGSAGDGMLRTGLRRNGIDAGSVNVVNQDPSVGASAIQGHQVDAFGQFVPWPQLVVFREQGQLLYDGGDNEVPTFHGVVVRKQFSEANPDVMRAFMKAMAATTGYIIANPLEAALRVSALTSIEPEVIYLYNGPNGLVSFDLTLKKPLFPALEQTKKFLVERGSVTPTFDISAFADDGYLRELLGADYQRRTDDLTNPIRLQGHDDVCGLPVDDARLASELWAGADHTEVSATPTCLLRRVAQTADVRAAYVPDTNTGTRLFAEHAVWLDDPAAPPTQRHKPFATEAGADSYRARHPQATPISYQAAVSLSRPTG